MNKQSNFDSYVRFNLNSRLNRFVHTDLREKTEPLEWFSEYFQPLVLIGEAVLSHYVESNKMK